MTDKRQSQPTHPQHHTADTVCAGCRATLVDDQRYCLECGSRRGQPRLDFSAFWRTTGAQASTVSPHSSDPSSNLSHGEERSPRVAGDVSWLGPGGPSRRVTGVLAAVVLAGGILAGGALGPGPANSLAGSSTIVQRALAALALGRTGPGSPTTTPAPEATTEATPAAKSTDKATQATSGPSAAGSSPGESNASEQPSEGQPSEESSSEGSGKGEKAASTTPVKLPPIKHVWVITLSGQSFRAALAQSKNDPYLATQLVPKGALLSNYKLTASSQLGNGIALLSGQGVNLETEHNCPTYNELQPPTINATTGLAEGVGCVYPAAVKTLADEITDGGLTWKAYVQGMSSAGVPGGGTQPTGTTTTPSSTTPTPTTVSPAPQSTPSSTPTPNTPAASVTCRHPALGATDPNHESTPGDPYVTGSNPFVFFHSLLDAGACASDDVDESALASDLASAATIPNLSWIVPSACDDGSATPCSPGAPTGIAPADGFLKEAIPKILATTAYREDGLIAIVPTSPPASPASAAGEPVGALLISPFVHANTKVSESFNDFSLLKSLARLFGALPLGHANDPGAVSFGATVYSTTEKAAQAASQARSSTVPHAGG